MLQSTLDAALAAAVPVLPDNQYTWSGYLLERRVEVGKVGPRWQQGGKIHRVYTSHIIGYVDGFQPTARQMKKGDVFSARTPCNSNGQHIAHPVAGWTDDMITCATCLKKS